ncbi:MAG TPA: hypothetical protein VK395_21330 [Gemmataceae bacterium]|nr:hypothetical protein [Gemmataceae bacterium]
MELDFGKELGATEPPLGQRLTLYIPNKDRVGALIPNHDRWAKEAQELLTLIGGGATAFPPVDGTWQQPDGNVLWEQTRVIYTFADPDKLIANFGRLHEFLHRFGRETGQGEVVVEFDGRFWCIRQFDSAREV